jgi:hypothetical protein
MIMRTITAYDFDGDARTHHRATRNDAERLATAQIGKYRPTRAQQAMAEAIRYMPGGVTRDERTLSRWVGTTVSGGTRTLRVMEARGLASCNLVQWSLTEAGATLAQGGQ